MSDALKIYVPAALLIVAAFWVAYRFVGPPPPREISIAAGVENGAYFRFATRYSEVLARDGITVNPIVTAGSVENLDHLAAGRADLAFVQGGTGRARPQEDLVSLGSVFYEPLWIFVREGAEVHAPSDLVGRRIAIGPEGSGTHFLASHLLRSVAGVTPDNTTLLDVEGAAATRALADGSADAAILVAAADSPQVSALAHTPGVRTVSIENGEAYTRHYRYLSQLTLPAGLLDLEDQIPAEPTVVVATATNLAARVDFHPALVDLLLGAAREIHGGGDWVADRGQFPSTAYLEFPLDPDAARYYEHGPPFLRRYLPFWAANLVDRLKILLLPAIALLIPLVRALPPVYQWRVRSRIYRWYDDLKRLDPELEGDLNETVLKSRMAELDAVEAEVKKLKTPLSYSDRVYNLRLHIDLVRNRLRRRIETAHADAAI